MVVAQSYIAMIVAVINCSGHAESYSAEVVAPPRTVLLQVLIERSLLVNNYNTAVIPLAANSVTEVAPLLPSKAELVIFEGKLIKPVRSYTALAAPQIPNPHSETPQKLLPAALQEPLKGTIKAPPRLIYPRLSLGRLQRRSERGV